MEETTSEYIPYFCPSCDFESPSQNLLLRHRLWVHDFGFKEHGNSVDEIEKNSEKSPIHNQKDIDRKYKLTTAVVELDKEQSKEYLGNAGNIDNLAILGKMESGSHKYVKEPAISNKEEYNNLFVNKEKSGEKEFTKKLDISKQNKNNRIIIKEETEEEQFDRELMEEENQKRLVICSLCPKTYNTYHAKVSLWKHMKIKHSSKRHMCDTCGKDFPSSCYLKRHNDGVHLGKVLNKTSTEFKCLQCNYSTHRPANLNDHNSVTHLGLDFNCKECSKSYSNLRNLKFHLSKNHQGKDLEHFKCGSCEYSSVRKETLKLHIQAKHDDERHRCELCKKTFSTYKCLRSHTRADHLNIRHACQTCDKTFSIRSTLNAHIEVHHERKQYVCSLCSFLSHSKIVQNKHFKIVHPKNSLPYPEIVHFCKICGCQKNSRRYLNQHIMKEHEGKKINVTKKKYSKNIVNTSIKIDGFINISECLNC